jgi:hypothetical protein
VSVGDRAHVQVVDRVIDVIIGEIRENAIVVRWCEFIFGLRSKSGGEFEWTEIPTDRFLTINNEDIIGIVRIVPSQNHV